MSAWEPDVNVIRSLVSLVERIALAQDNESHRAIHEQVKNDYKNPQFALYISCLLANANQYGIETNDLLKHYSSLLLKNALLAGLRQQILDRQTMSLIQQNLLKCVSDNNIAIRRGIASCVVAVVRYSGGSYEDPENKWPGLVRYLAECIHPDSPKSKDTNLVSGAFLIFQNICEESLGFLENSVLDNRGAFEVLIPLWIQYFQHQAFKLNALTCINHSLDAEGLEVLPKAIANCFDSLLQGFSSLAQDTDGNVRVEVCAGLTSLTLVRADLVQPHLNAIIPFVLRSMSDKDDSVVMRACFFWTEAIDVIKPAITVDHLQALLPLLAEKMIYSDDELMLFEDEVTADDVSKPDRQEDINPHVFREKDEDAEAFEEYSDMYTVRKSCGLTLDNLSKVFPNNVTLPILLPILERRIKSDDWIVKESALLAFSAIGEGCMEGLQGHLPVFIPYLLQCAQGNNKGPIRSMACYCIGAYSEWISKFKDENAEGQALFEQVLSTLLQRLLDNSKKVQRLACTACALLFETATFRLLQYSKIICEALVRALGSYRIGNMPSLIDVVGTFFESVADENSSVEMLKLLMPSLFKVFKAVTDSDRVLFAILECFGSMALQTGQAFVDYAQPIYDRCLQLMESTIVMASHATELGMSQEEVDREFMMEALEVLVCLAEGLGESFGALAKTGNGTLPALLLEVMNDSDDSCKHVGFQLVGEMMNTVHKCTLTTNNTANSSLCFQVLEPFLGKYMETMIQALSYSGEFYKLVNDAVWAIGRVSLVVKGELQPMVPRIMNRLVLLINERNLEIDISVNAVVTTSILALSSPDIVAQRLPECFVPFCVHLRNIDNPEERELCAVAICDIIEKHPKLVLEVSTDNDNSNNRQTQLVTQIGHFFLALCALAYEHDNLTDQQQQRYIPLRKRLIHIASVLRQQTGSSGVWEPLWGGFTQEQQRALHQTLKF